MAQSTTRRKDRKYNVTEVWSELKMAWKTYKIAKMNDDKSKMVEYSKRIRALQCELGSKESNFPELN